MRRVLFLALALLAAACWCAGAADAADKLRVGKASPQAFAFVPLDVGIAEGIFARNGIEAESVGL